MTTCNKAEDRGGRPKIIKDTIECQREERRKEICLLVQSCELSLRQIADKFGITRQRVQQIGKEEGISRRNCVDNYQSRKKYKYLTPIPEPYCKSSPAYIPNFIVKKGPGVNNPIRDAFVVNQYLLGRRLEDICEDLGLSRKGPLGMITILNRRKIGRWPGGRRIRNFKPTKYTTIQLLIKGQAETQ